MTRCNTDELMLTRALYGELNPVQRWRLTRHLRRCADCAAEWRSLQEVHTVLSANDLVMPEIVQPVPTRRLALGVPSRRLSLSLAGGAAITLLVGGALLVLPRTPRLFAATVGKALRGTNTWHLHGWKLVDGRMVIWDIWGRRNPYFYREQSGNEVVQEDDTTQTRFLPADPSVGRSQPVVLLLPATGLGKDNALLSYRNMVNAANWSTASGPYSFQPKPVRESVDATVFQTTESTAVMDTRREMLYTVDRRTGLPLSYVEIISQWNEGRQIRTQNESLQAQYNLPLPTQALAVHGPPGAGVVDLRRTPANAKLPAHDVATAGSLTVQAEPMVMDQAGNVLIRVRGWFGGILLAYVNTNHSLLHMDVNMSQAGNPMGRSIGPQYIKDTQGRPVLVSVPDVPLIYGDDQNRPYLFVQGALRPLPNGDWWVVLAPIEPLSGSATRPHRIRFTLAITPMTTLRPAAITDAPVDFTLGRYELNWTADLPTKSIPGSLASYYPPKARRFQRYNSLEADIASEIAGELNMVGRGSHDLGLLKKAVTWQERVVSLTRRDLLAHCDQEYILAQLQAYAEQTDAAARTLHEVMRVAERHPDWKRLRRQAAHALHNINRPDAWDSGW